MRRRKAADESVFDRFPWWDQGDVLTQITPSRFSYICGVADGLNDRRVLDLGCGGGLIAEQAARKGARVTGIDISQAALGVARRHAAGNCLKIGYLRGATEELPFDENSFDVVIAFDVLEHVSDLSATIGEVSRVLRPGGRFIYDTMNKTWFCRLVVVWIGEHLWKGGPPKGTHDWRKFIKPEALIRLLDRDGIANIETRGFLPAIVDLKGRLEMKLTRCKSLSYVGYGIKHG